MAREQHCEVILLVLRYPIPDKSMEEPSQPRSQGLFVDEWRSQAGNEVGTLGGFTSYRLLTLTKRKTRDRLNYI